LKYQYEPEGFILDNVSHYLPDFYLPEIDIWIEIKPIAYDDSGEPEWPEGKFWKFAERNNLIVIRVAAFLPYQQAYYQQDGQILMFNKDFRPGEKCLAKDSALGTIIQKIGKRFISVWQCLALCLA
jgi:hypothetical protein